MTPLAAAAGQHAPLASNWDDRVVKRIATATQAYMQELADIFGSHGKDTFKYFPLVPRSDLDLTELPPSVTDHVPEWTGKHGPLYWYLKDRLTTELVPLQERLIAMAKTVCLARDCAYGNDTVTKAAMEELSTFNPPTAVAQTRLVVDFEKALLERLKPISALMKTERASQSTLDP